MGEPTEHRGRRRRRLVLGWAVGAEAWMQRAWEEEEEGFLPLWGLLYLPTMPVLAV